MQQPSNFRRSAYIGSLFCFFSLAVCAQEKQKSVDIISTFKPELRESVKIDFSATPPPVDTTRPRLNYSIPNQNLYFTYQPISLKPMALQIDSVAGWDNSGFVKLGFGNYLTPVVQAGITLGDGIGNSLTIIGGHISSRGNIDFQDYSQTGARLNGTKRTAGNKEWQAGLKLQEDVYYRYGYTKPISVDKDSLLQRFRSIGGELGFRNLAPTEWGISYAPKLSLSYLTDNQKNNESSIKVNLPLQKEISESIGIDLALTADHSNYKRDNEPAIRNTLVTLAPAVRYKDEHLALHAGIRPSWDNSDFSLLPDFSIEAGTSDKEFVIQAGYTGYFRKTTFESLRSFNPWIYRPDSLRNNKITEFYGGIKGTLGSYFAYSAILGWTAFANTPLLANDTLDGKTFVYINERKMKALHLGGELSYTRGEDFYAHAALKMYRYTGLKTEEKAWGLIPTEVTAGFRWQPVKDLFIKSDLFLWEGAAYRKKDLTAAKQKGAFDLNFGAEFKVARQIGLWLQMNNILNSKYERWNQYEAYGFNVVGGIVFRFAE